MGFTIGRRRTIRTGGRRTFGASRFPTFQNSGESRSRFGVFVIETKDFRGWIVANATEETWTQVRIGRRFRFQNPLFRNKRHVRAVRELREFLPAEAIKSVIVFSGEAEYTTEAPQGVTTIGQLMAPV